MWHGGSDIIRTYLWLLDSSGSLILELKGLHRFCNKHLSGP